VAEPEAEPSGSRVRGGEIGKGAPARFKPNVCQDDFRETSTLWDLLSLPKNINHGRPVTAPAPSSSESRPNPDSGGKESLGKESRSKEPVFKKADEPVDHFPSAGCEQERALQKAIEEDSVAEEVTLKRSKTTPQFDSQADMGNTPSLPSCVPRKLSSPVRVLLIRHARSANKERNANTTASLDPDLSDVGFAQAEALGRQLSKDLSRVKAGNLMIASSPMRRCLETIRPAVHWTNLRKEDIFVMGAAFEFGCAGTSFMGSSQQDLEYEFPEFAPRCFSSAGYWDYRFSSKRETEAEVKFRAVQIVDWIWEMAETLSERSVPRGDKVLVMCIHQTMADILSQLLVDGHCDEFVYGQLKYKLQNTGITEVLLDDNCKASLGFQNRAFHMAEVRATVSQAQSAEGKHEKMSKLRTLFMQYDKSGNGRLDFGEMSALLRKGNPAMTEEELWALFAGADRTRDGDIDFDEFVEYIFSSSGPI
jgi:broad specificity phosphatase PhoE